MSLSIVSRSAAWLPMEWVRPFSGVALVVPFYHIVSDEFVPHVSHLYRFRTVTEFLADIEVFARHFTPVGLEDIVDALHGRRKLPRSCFHLTFDDGLSEVHEIVAPILERAGIPATFFLATAFLDGGGMAHHNEISLLLDRLESLPGGPESARPRLETVLPPATPACNTVRDRLLSIRYLQKALVRAVAQELDVDLDGYIRTRRPYLSSDQVRGLTRRGFTIGSHSCDHPLYRDLPLAEQLRQTRQSLSLLTSRFGIRQQAFAFPHNDDGVPEEFFRSVFEEPGLDVSFGTSGLVRHFDPRNLQRVSMEKTGAPAERILARQFTRATYFRLRSGTAAL
jgi:peptidoglycan/xylan/chitin deacetylase (PgdA/CDA1 family)